MGKMLRLDKYLADMQVGSRTEVKQLIKKGQVTVDGQKAQKPEQKIDIEKADVLVSGQKIGYVEQEYWMLHKPAGVITATEDRRCKTVLDFLPQAGRKDLFPVGRLDKDTEGLLLITNDGELAHELLSPKKHVDKTYYARIAGVVTKEDVLDFAQGLDIGEEKRTMPAKLQILSVSRAETGDPEAEGTEVQEDGLPLGRSEIQVTIQEGKFHQVKRMFEAVGKKVLYLKRLRMGTLVLDESLKPGEARPLTEEEIEGLQRGKKETFDYDQIQAAIFDLDGTLIDSMWMWYRIDEEFLGQFGAEVPDDLQKSIEGMSFTETAEYFKQRFPFLPYSVEQLKTIWNEMAYDKYAHEVTTKPGLVEYLQFLKEKGIKTGVATSNSRELAELALRNQNILEYFDSIRTSCEVEHGKPAPDIYLRVAKDLQVNPANCLAFEDVPAGLMAGNRAGMCTCAVADEFSAHMIEEKKKLAAYWVEDYKDMMP